MVCTRWISGKRPRVALVTSIESGLSIAHDRRCRPSMSAPGRDNSGSAIRGGWSRVSRQSFIVRAICGVPQGTQPQALAVRPIRSRLHGRSCTTLMSPIAYRPGLVLPLSPLGTSWCSVNPRSVRARGGDLSTRRRGAQRRPGRTGTPVCRARPMNLPGCRRGARVARPSRDLRTAGSALHLGRRGLRLPRLRPNGLRVPPSSPASR